MPDLSYDLSGSAHDVIAEFAWIALRSGELETTRYSSELPFTFGRLSALLKVHASSHTGQPVNCGLFAPMICPEF